MFFDVPIGRSQFLFPNMPTNNRLLQALRLQPVDRTPVWLMRQAGRYLPEYRERREQAGSFMALCTTPELACEVALQPLRRYSLDAAILFSDILTIPDAMGLGLAFRDNEGPIFRQPLRTPEDIKALGVPDPEDDLGYVMDAVRLTRAELHDKVPLIGFAGSPWTLATYMVEGRATTQYRYIKTLLYDAPKDLHALLQVVANAVIGYLSAQARAGAQVLMIFDSWGGVLTPAAYREFSLAYMTRIIVGVREQLVPPCPPIVVFTKGGGAWIGDTVTTGCDAIGLDWTADLNTARAAVCSRVCLQGNLDPAVLYAQPLRIRAEVERVLAAYGHGSGHVFNLGHGVQPQTDPDRVQVCIEAVQTLSPQYHR